MRYTIAGIVCMKSSTGRIAALKVSLRAARIPTGTAITIATSAAMSVSESMCIAFSH